jgi:hypothetical protein
MPVLEQVSGRSADNGRRHDQPKKPMGGNPYDAERKLFGKNEDGEIQ